METATERLKNAGLPGNEAKVYLELLRRGSISANKLAKLLGLDRTLAYQILNSLIEKGLASYIIKEKKKWFAAADPENLLRPVKEREQAILSLIPELKSLEKVSEQEQDVRVYEGKQGLKTFFEELIKSKKIAILGATGKSYDVLKFERPHLLKKALESGLTGRMITSIEFKNHEMTQLRNMQVKYMEEIKGPATTTVYKDTVAIHILSDKPIVIIIKNKGIAESYQNYFEFLWKTAKK